MYQEKNLDRNWDDLCRFYNAEHYWDMPAENLANFEMIRINTEPVTDKDMIEMGSGSGLLSLRLARMEANITLLDYSEISMDYARKQFIEARMPCDHYVEDALDNNVPSNRYDHSYNVGVLEHFYDDGKKKLIAEMLRVVKPGGSVIILVPNSHCLPFMAVQIFKKAIGKWGYGYEDDMSPGRLKKMLGEMGLQAEVFGFNPICGWLWIPGIRQLINATGFGTLKRSMRHTRWGMTTAAIIKKKTE